MTAELVGILERSVGPAGAMCWSRTDRLVVVVTFPLLLLLLEEDEMEEEVDEEDAVDLLRVLEVFDDAPADVPLDVWLPTGSS